MCWSLAFLCVPRMEGNSNCGVGFRGAVLQAVLRIIHGGMTMSELRSIDSLNAHCLSHRFKTNSVIKILIIYKWQL